MAAEALLASCAAVQEDRRAMSCIADGNAPLADDTTLNPFCAAFPLSVAAQRVIELRSVRIAWGGADMASMVGEVVAADTRRFSA